MSLSWDEGGKGLGLAALGPYGQAVGLGMYVSGLLENKHLTKSQTRAFEQLGGSVEWRDAEFGKGNTKLKTWVWEGQPISEQEAIKVVVSGAAPAPSPAPTPRPRPRRRTPTPRPPSREPRPNRPPRTPAPEPTPDDPLRRIKIPRVPVPGVLSRVITPILGVLWPVDTSASDVIYGPGGKEPPEVPTPDDSPLFGLPPSEVDPSLGGRIDTSPDYSAGGAGATGDWGDLEQGSSDEPATVPGETPIETVTFPTPAPAPAPSAAPAPSSSPQIVPQPTPGPLPTPSVPAPAPIPSWVTALLPIGATLLGWEASPGRQSAWWSNPTPAPTPTPTPEILPSPVEFPAVSPAPSPTPLPSTLPSALPSVIPFNPLSPGISPSPSPSPSPAPRPAPSPSPSVSTPLEYLTGLQPGAVELPQPQPVPQENPDKCNCRQQKRQQKKRKPRTVCYRGTFYETARGTVKHRKERIACNAYRNEGSERPRKLDKRQYPVGKRLRIRAKRAARQLGRDRLGNWAIRDILFGS